MRMHEKTMGYVLFFCPNAVCKIATFYKSYQCPCCGEPGSIVRMPVTSRGIPFPHDDNVRQHRTSEDSG